MVPRLPGRGSSRGRVSRFAAGPATREGRSTTPACRRARWWRVCRSTAATRPVTPTGSEMPRRQPGTPSASVARVDKAVTALSRSVDAARSAYEERSAQLESAVPRFAFELLEALFDRESVLAVDPGREAGGPGARSGRKLPSGRRPALARRRRHHRGHRGALAFSPPDGRRRFDGRTGWCHGRDRVDHHRQSAVTSSRKSARVIVGHTEEDPR